MTRVCLCPPPLGVRTCFVQVLVLELEARLQKERERLGELRKKHYELAGVAEGWGADEEGEGRPLILGGTSKAVFANVNWAKEH